MFFSSKLKSETHHSITHFHFFILAGSTLKWKPVISFSNVQIKGKKRIKESVGIGS